MKKLIQLFSTTLLIIIIHPCLSFGQDASFRLNRLTHLSGDLVTEEILLKVDEQTTDLSFQVNSIVREGTLLIEIYDPNDEKQGFFSIGSLKNTQKKEPETGSFNKVLTDPITGNWKIKIIPNQAKGDVRISSILSFAKQK